MSFMDRLRVSLRHIRGRMVESILVILATAVGVALVAAMAAFIHSYNRQTDYLLSHPAYRELLVETVGEETELDEPAVEYDPDVSREVSLGYEQVALALEATTVVTYGYIADSQELSTRTMAGIRGMAGMRGMGGDPGPPPEAGGGIVAPGVDGDMPTPLEGDTPQTEGAMPSFRGAQPEEFDLEQFFAVDDDVLTDLPLESFPGRSVTTDFFEAYGLDVNEGSGMTIEDIESGNQVIVLGSTLADALFPEGNAIGTRVRLNMQTYTVVGILAPTALTDTNNGTSFNDIAFVPNSEAQVEFAGRTIRINRPTRTLRFAVSDSDDLDAAAAELETFFETEYGEGSVKITAPLEELQTERDKLSRILSVVLFLAAAGLFIASINLFNLMLMRVIKHTKAIGITRALGATRNGISRQFLNESAMMSFTGAVVGLAASPLVYGLLRTALIEDVSGSGVVNWPFLVLGAAAAFVFSLVFGVGPARQAGRIDAALAIRSE